jgi:lipoprotein-anchoring transpeptidase ErfK/SrfK
MRPRTVEAVQRKLVGLGFLPPGSVNGRFGDRSRTAVIAFQKWEGLARDGIPGPLTQRALADATRPAPQTRGGGTRVEILLDRQVLLLVRRGRVVRTMHVSTGKRRFETPTGRYEVLRKRRRSWSVPYEVWLPWASYFVGGFAVHQAKNVPVRPASHGCVRVTRYDARWLFSRMPVGTPVRVLARS